MSKKEDIIALPHSNLRKKSKKVGIVNDGIKQLVEDMEESTLDWEDSREHEVGVALAAVQINKLFKVVVIRSNFDDKNDRTFITLINPKIIKYEGKLEEDFEGCLSIKDVYGKVPRYTKVKVKALNIDGKEVRITAEDFLARVLQHEIDHTDGIVFIDHIKDSPKSFFILNREGKLEALNYDKDIKDNKKLWS
jgi:peptide deformylase